MESLALKYWRIEDTHYACFDITDECGNVIDTYEAYLPAYLAPGWTWVDQVQQKSWAFPEMLQELAMVESAYWGVKAA